MAESRFTVKTIALMWDIRDEDSRPYMEFISQRWLPALTDLGLARQEVLFRLVGEGPEIFTVLEAPTEWDFQRALASDEWRRLLDELSTYVVDFRIADMIAPRARR